MENKTTPQLWAKNRRVKEDLKTLSLASQEAYQNFVDKLNQGYYPLGQEELPNSPGCISFVLVTGERVIYRIVESEIIIERIETSFMWKLSARFTSTLDRIGRVMTLQQIFSMLASFLGIKLF